MEKSPTSEGKFHCPSCSRSFSIPASGADAFPHHSHLAFEVEVAGYMSKCADGQQVSCNFCANGCTDAAIFFCCTCRKFMCSTGQYCHNRVPTLCHHSMVKLDQELAAALPTLLKPVEPTCAETGHKKLELEYYCQTCSCSICRCCTVVQHMEHNIAELSSVAESHRVAMKLSLQRAKQAITALTNAVSANVKMADQLETSKQAAESDIKKAFVKLQEILEERKKALLSELEASLLSKMQSLILQKEQLEHLQKDIGRYIEVTSHSLQTNSDHELVSLEGLMSTELDAYLGDIEAMSLTPHHRTLFTASVQTDKFQSEMSNLGSILELSPDPLKSTCTFRSLTMVNTVYRVQVESNTVSGQRYPCGGIQVSAELKSNPNQGSAMSGVMEDHGDGTYTITFTPQSAGPHQLSIMMDGRSLQGSPFNVEVRGDYAHLHDSEKVLSVGGKSLCVAIHKNGDIYVGCDDHRIYAFNQDGLLKNTMGSWGSGDGQFKCPFGICFKEDTMYIVDCANHRVQALTTGGEFLHKFGEKGQENGQFNNPCGIAIDSNSRIIISDSGNNRIQIFGEGGSWLLTVDGKENSRHTILGPRGVALDSQGNIHVAAYVSNAIKVFTPEGAYLRKYGGGLKGPTGVAVDELGYSMVCDWGGNCLTVIDPEGHVTCSVGNPCRPCRVALDIKSGCVFVANYDYNNILKFVL